MELENNDPEIMNDNDLKSSLCHAQVEEVVLNNDNRYFLAYDTTYQCLLSQWQLVLINGCKSWISLLSSTYLPWDKLASCSDCVAHVASCSIGGSTLNGQESLHGRHQLEKQHPPKDVSAALLPTTWNKVATVG
jgi:hypothetical protein